MTKYKILDILLKNKGKFISGEKLSEQLGVSRTAVWKGIQSLKEKGYNIEGINNKGYILLEENIISNIEIKKIIKCKEIGNRIIYFEKIDSTNTYLKKEYKKLEHGCVVISEEQIKGRTKNEKNFYSPKEKGIYMSILLKKDIFLDSIKLLTLTTFLSIIKGIEKTTGLLLETNWNGIYINDKKVAGVLVEHGQDDNYIIVGIGINVNNQNFPKELKDKVTSLRIEKSQEINRQFLICNILEEFENLICKKRYIFNREKNIEEYYKFFKILNKNIVLTNNQRKIVGKVLGVNENGGIILLKEDNKREIFYDGEIKRL